MKYLAIILGLNLIFNFQKFDDYIFSCNHKTYQIDSIERKPLKYDRISFDSINTINIDNYYLKVDNLLLSKIKHTLNEDAYNGIGTNSVMYLYKIYRIDIDKELIISIGQSKYGYGRIYATLYDNEEDKAIQSKLIAHRLADAGDYYDLSSIIWKQKGKSYICLHEFDKYDTLTQGNIYGEYKVTTDSISIYEIQERNFKLIKTKSGI